MLMIIMLRYTNMKNDIFLTFKIIISFEYIYRTDYNYKLLHVKLKKRKKNFMINLKYTKVTHLIMNLFEK